MEILLTTYHIESKHPTDREFHRASPAIESQELITKWLVAKRKKFKEVEFQLVEVVTTTRIVKR